jgi:hypothetical protein
MSGGQQITKHYSHKPALFLAFSLIILIAASIFIGYQQGRSEIWVGTVPGDFVSYNNALESPLKLNDVYVNPEHSFIFKFPIFLLQNLIGSTENVMIVTSILLLLLMNLGIAALIWSFSGKNRIIAGMGLLALASITLMTNPNQAFMSLSWVTIRNIEIPLAILLLRYGLRHRKMSIFGAIPLAILFGLVMVSDKLIAYNLVFGLFIFLVFELLASRRGFWRRNRRLVVFSILSLAATYAWQFGLDYSGLVKFSAPTNYTTTLLPSSLSDIWRSLLDAFSSLFNVFGAGVFGQDVLKFTFLACILNVVILTLSVVAMVSVSRFYLRYFANTFGTARYESSLVVNLRNLTFLICFALGAVILYVLLVDGPGTYNARYLIFFMPIGLLALVYAARIYWQKLLALYNRLRYKQFNLQFLKFVRRCSITIVIIPLILVALGVETLATSSNYAEREPYISNQKIFVDDVIKVLDKYNVHVLLGAYSEVHLIKWRYDQTHAQSLDINIMTYCANMESKSAKRSWHQADKSAVIILQTNSLPCPPDDITNIWGKAGKIVKYEKGDVHFLVYKRDIRSTYDLSQFDGKKYSN